MNQNKIYQVMKLQIMSEIVQIKMIEIGTIDVLVLVVLKMVRRLLVTVTTVIRKDIDHEIALNLFNHDDKHHPRTKHIDIKYHFVRDLVKDNKIVIKWVPTHKQSADIFTKGLRKIKFRQFRKDIMDYAT